MFGRGVSLYAGLHGSEPCDHFILLIKKQIMKFKKFIIPALCMAMLSAGCSGQDPVTPGNGQNGNGGTNENIENGLQVTASTTVINADGQDAARINFYYDKVKLSLDAVAFYDAKSNDVLDLSKFTIEDNTLVYTVTEPGEFSFWVAYKTHNTKDRPAGQAWAKCPDTHRNSGKEREDEVAGLLFLKGIRSKRAEMA